MLSGHRVGRHEIRFQNPNLRLMNSAGRDSFFLRFFFFFFFFTLQERDMENPGQRRHQTFMGKVNIFYSKNVDRNGAVNPLLKTRILDKADEFPTNCFYVWKTQNLIIDTRFRK